MPVFEKDVSSLIIRRYCEKLLSSLEVETAIVGAGPSALVTAYYLARSGISVSLFERGLAPGGGVWGGAMLFNEVAVEEYSLPILDDFGIPYVKADDGSGLYTIDSVMLASGLIFGAVKAGARLFNSVAVEDIVFKNDRVNGLVVNWNTVRRAGMMVDPLTVIAKCVMDATGHPCEIMRLAAEKAGVRLDTPTGGVMGEKPMWAEPGEDATVESTREFYPGLFASGMSATNVTGGYRMGPVFGGMLRSGYKAAGLIAASLGKKLCK